MLFLVFLLGIFLAFLESEAYVLLQVRKKDANHSNVDALIHKTVPSSKFDAFAERMGENQKKAKEKVLKRKNITGVADRQNNSANGNTAEKSNLFFSLDNHRQDNNLNVNLRPVNKARPINNMASDEDFAGEGLEIPVPGLTREPDLEDLFVLVGRKFAKGPSGPMFRSDSQGVLFQPKIVQFKTGKSAVYDIQPDNLIIALKELLSSVTFQRYVDKLSRKAAVVYRTVENDLQPIAAKLVDHYKDY